MPNIFGFIFLFLTLQLSAQTDFKPLKNKADFTRKFSEASAKINTIKSDFTQEKHLSMLEEKIISKGVFWFKKEQKVRMEYSSPTKYLIIMNDKIFRIKDDSGDKKMATGGNKLFQQISQITADCIRGNVLNNKDFITEVFENSKQYKIEMKPLSKQMKTYFSSIHLMINKSDLDVASIVMNEPSGDFTRLSFLNKKLNSSISDEVFSVK